MLLQNKSNEEIMKSTGVSRTTISRINKGETHYNPSL